MAPINLNLDATTFILNGAFSRCEIATSDSEKENNDAYDRNRELIDVNSSLEFPTFAVNNRKLSFHTCMSWTMYLIFISVFKSAASCLIRFAKMITWKSYC